MLNAGSEDRRLLGGYAVPGNSDHQPVVRSINGVASRSVQADCPVEIMQVPQYEQRAAIALAAASDTC